MSRVYSTLTALLLFTAGGHCASQEYEFTLKPGEGTILYLGTEKEYKEVRSDYFSPGSHPGGNHTPGQPGDPYRLDYMPLGIYTGDHTADAPQAAAAMGISVWDWFDRLFKLLKGAEVNTLFVQGGGSIAPASDKVLSGAEEFARFAHARGFRVMIQPSEVFFRSPAYFSPGSYYATHFKDSETYYRDSLVPSLRQYMPRFRDNKDIFAWAPVEEMEPAGEPIYTEYKKLLRELAPHQLLYQDDSPQSNAALLASKQPPYPDISVIDRYVWTWVGVQHPKYGNTMCLATPNLAAKTLYQQFKDYADGVRKVFNGQALGALPGPAIVEPATRAQGAAWGWKEEVGFVPPALPTYHWDPEHQIWLGYSWYLPPPNAERLSSWLAICAGMKGIMIWAPIIGKSPHEVADLVSGKTYKPGTYVMAGIIHYDLTTTPQFQELGETWKQLKPLSNLILAMEPSDTEYAAVADKSLMYERSFTDKTGRRFVVVVNGKIGDWDGNSPDYLDYPKTKLTIGPDCNLVGFTPATEPRKIKLSVPEDSQVFDLRNP